MRVVGLIAGVVVGVTLVVAGVLKSSDRVRWRTQAADLGVHGGLAQVVPAVEIVLGAVLIAQLGRPWPALAAAGLLTIFTIVILLRLRDGDRPPCACFGARSSRPLGAWHVLRNLGLIALAAVAAVWA